MIGRRSFLTGLAGALITAPAIVRADALMPVKVMMPAKGWYAEYRMAEDQLYIRSCMPQSLVTARKCGMTIFDPEKVERWIKKTHPHIDLNFDPRDKYAWFKMPHDGYHDLQGRSSNRALA